jgi:ethanolamine utilization protein EutN
MFLGRVIGTLVATIKHEALKGVKLLVVQPVDEYGKPYGQAGIAADGTHMAGPGETVWCIDSREGSLVLKEWFTPVDNGILGIVDEIWVITGGREQATLQHGRPVKGAEEA